MTDVRRREFITLLGGTAAAWPLAARAQQAATPVVGFLSWGSARLSGRLVAAFRGGLAEVGYVEPQNVSVELRWAGTQSERLPALAAELVQRKVAVIVAGGFGGPIFAAKAATSTIPIVFAYGGDPVKAGIVESFNRPGGNVTGVTTINAELGSKWLSLIGDLVPRAVSVGFLSADTDYAKDQKSQMVAAARALGRQIVILEPRGDREYEMAFKTLVEREAGALVVGPFAFRNIEKIVTLAASYKIPTIYPRRDYVEAGGLMSYAADYADTYRQAGVYAGRILRGAKPSELPVMQATKFELVINLKTAKALGIEVPATLLAPRRRGDRMMGWMAPLRHLGAKVLVGRETTSEQGAIHERDYDDRVRLGEACFPGTRGRCSGGDGSAQAASAGAGSGVLQSTAALSGGDGGMCDGALLGAGVERVGP